MAEMVERHMESMTEEIEEMIRIKLFTKEETRAILKKRKQLEYRINGVSKNLADFKDYIQYEKILLKDIKVRRNKYRLGDRKNNIEFKILKRIKHLYEIAYQRFSNDLPLCLSYIRFCRESSFTQATPLIIQNMLKNFSHNPEVWKVAAGWYSQKDVNQALNVLHKGLMIHKDSQSLYSEAIQLELQHREKNDLSKDPNVQNTNDELCCEKIKAYVLSIFKNIENFRYLIEVLKILETHSITLNIQELIVKRLMEYYSDEELVWDALAQRERNPATYRTTDAGELRSTRYCLNRCFKKYQEGLSKITLSKKPALWTLYLDCLVELQQKNDVANMIKKNTLLAALEEASNEINLDEKYFLVWAKLTDNESETLRVLEKGIAALPTSIDLWKLRLKYAIMKDNVKEVNQAFKRAIVILKENGAAMWLMALRYHTLTSANDVIESVYKSGIGQPKEISDVLKPEYIQWVSLCKGIKEARKAYDVLAQQQPYCKELHTAMFKIESLEINQDVEKMEKVLKLSSEQFGKEDVDVWINYVELYLNNHKVFEDKNPSFDVNDKILEIYRKAVEALKFGGDGFLLADFKEKFESIRNSTDI